MKYELTDETKKVSNHTVARIRALKDFGDVKAGDLGGWIEAEGNLSQGGDCWVYDEAVVFGEAMVSDHAIVRGNATVRDHAIVHGGAGVFDSATVSGRASVAGMALVFGNARITGQAQAYNTAQISGHANVKGNAEVCEDARVFGDVCLEGCMVIGKNAKVQCDQDVCFVVPNVIGTTEFGEPVSVSLPLSPLDGTTFYRDACGKLSVANTGRSEGAGMVSSRLAAEGYSLHDRQLFEAAYNFAKIYCGVN